MPTWLRIVLTIVLFEGFIITIVGLVGLHSSAPMSEIWEAVWKMQFAIVLFISMIALFTCLVNLIWEN